jgi:hypothetical protein
MLLLAFPAFFDRVGNINIKVLKQHLQIFLSFFTATAVDYLIKTKMLLKREHLCFSFAKEL